MKDMILRMSNIESKVTNIELTLENEICVNIKRVAEGHLDLSRNLHDALKVDSEKEMLVIRVIEISVLTLIALIFFLKSFLVSVPL